LLLCCVLFTCPPPLQAVAVAEFQTHLHARLKQQLSPFGAICQLYGLSAAQLGALVERFSEGEYIEMSASFASPDASAYLPIAPVIFDGSSIGGKKGLMADVSSLQGGEEHQQYCTALRTYVRHTKGQVLGDGREPAAVAVWFRLSAFQLALAAASTVAAAAATEGPVAAQPVLTPPPWVLHQWHVPTAVAIKACTEARKK